MSTEAKSHYTSVFLDGDHPDTSPENLLTKIPDVRRPLRNDLATMIIIENNPGLLEELWIRISGETIAPEKLVQRINLAISTYLYENGLEESQLRHTSREKILTRVLWALRLDTEYEDAAMRYVTTMLQSTSKSIVFDL